MPHHTTVFHDALKLIPWNVFDKLVVEHATDDLVRKFSTRHQLIALLFAQLAGSVSLREIETTMESHKARLYHAGAKLPRRSTFADANASRDPAVFSGLFEHMLHRATRTVRRQLRDLVRLVDSTSLHLAGNGAQWARFSANVCGAKTHVVYDPDAGCPLYHAVTAANVNDITAAKAMPIEPGATYVFDLGYYDYGWWAALDDACCRIVTRFKVNTPLLEPRMMTLDPGTPDVLCDRIGFLPARLSSTRRNPMQVAVREIAVMTETGKVLRLLSNDLDAPAQEIADLYKRRWQIELFFRLVKQTLRITHFIGRSENAVRIQVAVALVAFLVLRMIQTVAEVKHGFLELARLIRSNLMHRKCIKRLRQIEPPTYDDPAQLMIDWATA